MAEDETVGPPIGSRGGEPIGEVARAALSSVSVSKLVESFESFVIQGWRFDSRGDRRCGRLRAITCDTRAT
jgi:hypothetical protein